MTLSSKVDAYPASFHEIAAKGYRCQEAFSIAFGSVNAAIAFRMQWYGFLKALDAEAKLQPACKDEYGNLVAKPLEIEARNGRALKFSISGCQLTITPRELTPLGNATDEVVATIDAILTKQEAASTAWIAERKQERLTRHADTAKNRSKLAQAAKDAETEGEEEEADRAKRLSKLAKLDSPEEEPEVEKTRLKSKA